MTDPTPPLRLVDPHFGRATERIQSNMDAEIYRYFFRSALAGERGVRQAIINTFMQKLYDAAKAAKVTDTWDPANESIIAELLSRLNFNEQRTTKPRSVKPRRADSTSSITPG